MKLIKPYYEIINENDLIRAGKEIEQAARTCYKSEDKITNDSYKELVHKLIVLGHEAMLEFGPSITVKFVCDRGVSHELVRHRLCDFAQESTRYCNYSKDKFDNQVTFIIPEWNKDTSEGEYHYKSLQPSEDKRNGIWLRAMKYSEDTYNLLISEGWSPQQARAVLPNSLKTEINMKANIREWRHIFRQRCSSKAHPQMRELMIPLLKHFQKNAPELFNDILEECSLNIK